MSTAVLETTTKELLQTTTTTATTTATATTITATTTNLTNQSRSVYFARDTTSSFGGTSDTTNVFNLTAFWTTSDVIEDGPISYYLWLPYVIFTIALLGLICCSFLRFHTERGIQYRRRQEELSDKIQPSIQDGLRLLPDSTADISAGLDESPTGGGGGGANHSNHRGGGGGGGGGLGGVVDSLASQRYMPQLQQPNGVPRGGGVPEQMTFAQYNQVRPTDRYASADVHSSVKHNSHMSFSKKSSPSSQIVVGSSSNKKSGAFEAGGSGAARRPLVFTFNINGSMVDVRCGEEERTNTFRLMPNDLGGGSQDRDRDRDRDECVVITEDFDLGVRGGSSKFTAGEFDRHYYSPDGTVGKRGYANHRKHTTSLSGPEPGADGPSQHRNGAIAAITSSDRSHHGGGGANRHHPNNNCENVQYRAGGSAGGAGQPRYERTGDGEPNRRSAEDEALLLWQKHL